MTPAISARRRPGRRARGGAQAQSICFDARAKELGLSVGETYAMDIFHAERHTMESIFRIATSIACFKDVETSSEAGDFLDAAKTAR